MCGRDCLFVDRSWQTLDSSCLNHRRNEFANCPPHAASLLKTVLAVPLQKARMRAFKLAARRKRAAALVYECLHAIEVVDLSRDQNFQIVG